MANKNKNTIQAADEQQNKGSVIGVFTGKCCDAGVMNNNDMHLGRELFETLIASEDYKRAMENHHYIGYLGHPADPDCQDYEHACIVMKDMRIMDNDEIEGDFDLIDTPVGRVVKSFIDAGVNFGISIRGLGDVDGNGEVDPDGFIFRGFDLVTFPAYDDCIPEFKAIAASTDMKKKAAYKKICASIDANLPDISSPTTLGMIQEQFEDGCDEYNHIQDRIDELTGCDDDAAIVESVTEEKLAAVTELYLDAAEKVRELEGALVDCQTDNQELLVECKTLKSKFARYKKIVASQLETAKDNCDSLENKNSRLSNRVQITRQNFRAVKANLAATRKELDDVKAERDEAQNKYKSEVKANSRLERKIESLRGSIEADKESIEASNNLNLKYQRKIEANSEAISQKDSAIEDLKAKLHETVVANEQLESEASNLDVKCKELLSRVEAAEEVVYSYQQAYANMYANALGVYLSDLPITASTSVDDLKEMIKAGTSTAGIPAGPDVGVEEVEEDYIVGEDDEDYFDETEFNAEMVTM